MKVVLDSEYRNWILGAVVRESRHYSSQKIQLVYLNTSRSKYPINYVIRKYFNKIQLEENDLIVNQKTLLFLINSKMIDRNFLPALRCHFTHDSKEFLLNSGLASSLKFLKEILVLNASDADMLVSLGINRSKIVIIYGAIDRGIFHPSESFAPNREVFISGDAKGRKNPLKIINLINSCPDMKFVICGRYWAELVKSQNMKFENFVLHEFNLEKTALLVRQASAYLTLSFQEGGPFPVLEALASGTPVVSTPVGWVPEIINRTNGVVVGQEASLDQVRAALEECFRLKASIWERDLIQDKFTWGELAMKMYGIPIEGRDQS